MPLRGGPVILRVGLSSPARPASRSAPPRTQDPGTPVSLIELTSYWATTNENSRTEYREIESEYWLPGPRRREPSGSAKPPPRAISPDFRATRLARRVAGLLAATCRKFNGQHLDARLAFWPGTDRVLGGEARGPLGQLEVRVGLREAAVRLGLVEHDDDDLIYEEPAPVDGYADDDQLLEDEETGGLPAVGRGFHIASIEPQNFADAHTIGEYFRHDIPVIINLHGMTVPDAKRIVDFASGLI